MDPVGSGDESSMQDDLLVDSREIADDDHEGPVFIDTNEAVEVDVDLEHEPMDDDDDDGAAVTQVGTEEKTDSYTAKAVVDMAKYVLSSHTGPIYSTASIRTAESIVIASGGGDDMAFLHTISTNQGFPTTTTQELTPPNHTHTDTITAVAFNSSTLPAVLATGCYDGTIQLWDVKEEDAKTVAVHVRQLDGPSDIEWLTWHPNGGTVLLAGSTDGTVWMWFVPTGKCLQVFVGHSGDTTAGSFTPDGKFAVTSGVDGTLRIWAPKTGICKYTFGKPYAGGTSGGERFAEGALTCMAMSDDIENQFAAVGCEDGAAWIVHLTNKKVLGCLHHYIPSTQQDYFMQDDDTADAESRSIEAVGFAPHSLNVKWFATAGVDGVLKIWDTTSNQCRQTCFLATAGGAAAGVTRLLWHTSLPLIYSAASDGVIRLWDAKSGRCLTTLTGHSDTINDLSIIFGDGTIQRPDLIIAGSDDNSVRIFEVNVAECMVSNYAIVS